MSNFGIAGFEKFSQKGELKIPTRKDLGQYFEDTFYHKPTDEQLKLFHEFLIGKEKDTEKVLEFCSKKLEDVQIEKQ